MLFYKNRKRTLRRILKITGWTILSIIVIINLIILISGKFHLYKTIQNTLLQGRFVPTIHEKNIFFNRPIEASSPQEWKAHPRLPAHKLSDQTIERLKSIDTESFLIIKNNRLYFEQYWTSYHNANKDEISNSFSVAKSILSILIGIARDEGLISDLDQPIGNFVESYNTDGKELISLRHLLTMSSGLNWDESPTPFSDNTEAYYGTDLEDLMNKQEVAEAPGIYFDYMSGNTQLLGFALEKATGMSVSEYAQRKLWGPINATTDALWNLDGQEGHEKTFCCFYATPRDFARIGQLFLNKGMWNGKRVISEAYIQETITPADLRDKNTDLPNTKYGLSWWIDNYEGLQIYYARGILGQYIICIPKYDLVIVRTGYQRGEKLETDHPSDLYWYIDAAIEMMLNDKA